MTSDKQTRANRANAERSTGPRTAAGKSAARLNARRHGLAASLRLEPGADEEVERLARAITGEDGRLELLDLARRIAEAEFILRRTRRARLALSKIPPRPDAYNTVESSNSKLFTAAIRRVLRRKEPSIEALTRLLYSKGWDPEVPEQVVIALKRRAKDFESAALDRYERRAFSRRKTAVREFDLAWAQSVTLQSLEE